MWSEPFFAEGPITTDAAVFEQPPNEVIDAYLAACLVLAQRRPRSGEACSEDAVGARRPSSG
jgi:hypothetical protein